MRLFDSLFAGLGIFSASNSHHNDPVAQTIKDGMIKASKFSAAAYCDTVLKQTWNCGGNCEDETSGFTVTKTFGNTNSMAGTGFIAVNSKSKEIVLSFRGTKSISDWVSDVIVLSSYPDWIKTPFEHKGNSTMPKGNYLKVSDGMKMHKGFQIDYTSVRNEVQNEMNDLIQQHPSFPVYVVGHSLGGALASIAAADLANLHGPDVASRTHIYTFGSPRIGDVDWVNFIDGIKFGGISRVTRQKDPVPHIPHVEIGYLHHSEEFGILENGEIVTCTKSGNGGETTDCMNKNILIPDIDAHTAGYFVGKIEDEC